MAKGLAVPVRVSPTGRTMQLEGEENAEKIISLALSDNDNDNAFQQEEGLDHTVVFDISNNEFRARVLARLLKLFSDFEREKLFKLNKSTIKWSRGAPGETVLEFQYVNLESDETATFVKPFTARKKGA